MLNEEIGSKVNMSNRLSSLGSIEMARESLEAAEAYYMRSLLLSVESGDKDGIAIQHANLGLVAFGRNDTAQARLHWHKALMIFEAEGSADAERVRALLDELEQ